MGSLGLLGGFLFRMMGSMPLLRCWRAGSRCLILLNGRRLEGWRGRKELNQGSKEGKKEKDAEEARRAEKAQEESLGYLPDRAGSFRW